MSLTGALLAVRRSLPLAPPPGDIMDWTPAMSDAVATLGAAVAQEIRGENR